nr:MAG TPA: hypothetical protein [Bacteriophage sp.]
MNFQISYPYTNGFFLESKPNVSKCPATSTLPLLFSNNALLSNPIVSIGITFPFGY